MSSTPSPETCEGSDLPALAWQKSSYCAQGNSCIHIAADHGSIALTESGDPTGAVLRTSPTAWTALIRTVKETHTRG